MSASSVPRRIWGGISHVAGRVGGSQDVRPSEPEQAPSKPQGIPDIAARLAVMFPDLPQDTIQAVLSQLFRADANCTREQLADRAVLALLEMSSVDGGPQALTCFEPRTSNGDANPIPSGACAEQALSDTGVARSRSRQSDAAPDHALDSDVFDQALDGCIAELLSLPDAMLRPCIATLLTIVGRVLDQPNDQKVRRLRRGNARFQNEVGQHEAALDLLRLGGFQDSSDANTGETIIMLPYDTAVPTSLSRVRDVLRSLSEDLNLEAPTTLAKCGNAVVHQTIAKTKKPSSASGVRAGSREQRRQRIAELTEQRLRDPAAFRRAAKNRGAANRVIAPLVRRPVPVSTAAEPSRRSRHFTLSDLERMRTQDEIANMPSYAEEYRAGHQAAPVHDYGSLVARGYDPELVARQALDGTNKYRSSKNLQPLRWNDGIARIARQHAEQMASGTMPFSHEGFDRRVAAFPISHRSAAENLALNTGYSNVATVAVEGWIKSPGHEKNLSGRYNTCGIGVARASNGTFYLTQLFAYAL